MLRVITALFALLLTSIQSQRTLSGQTFGSYETRTSVSDRAAIAYDQAEVESLLNQKTEAELDSALQVYERGGNSKSYALIQLNGALTAPAKKETLITGLNADGGVVTGTTFNEVDIGTSTLKFQYAVSEALTDRVGCRVGGLEGNARELSECLANSGSVIINGEPSAIEYEYSYDRTTDNYNARTLKGFSAQAGVKMQGFKDFQAFRAYYGYDDYADRWVQGAYDGGRTVFTNGVADWSNSNTLDGRIEAIGKGSVYMNVAMYVIFELEDAIIDCKAGCATDECNAGSVNALDEGIAFYYGATWDQTDDGGHLLYALAQKRCKNFATCGPSGDKPEGTAKINLDITSEMKAMKVNLNQGECSAAIENKENVANMMKVPLIQGTLRYAYMTDRTKGNQWSESNEAKGATFAASLLGWMNECSPEDAETVYSNMKVGQGGNANFEAVKEALENQYDCLGVSCSAVGGLRDEDLDAAFGVVHLPGAGPCTFGSAASSVSLTTSTVLISLVVSIAAFLL